MRLSKWPGQPARLGPVLVGLMLTALVLSACGQQDLAPASSTALPALPPTATPVPAPALLGLGSNQLGQTTVKTRLIGSGSTFADPIYKNWINPANAKGFSKTSPNVTIDYQATGSGNGRSALLNTPVSGQVGDVVPVVPVDFAGSDSPFKANELSAASSKGQLIHIPTAVGAVVAVYNLKEVPQLKLSGPTLAGIFLGKINRWDDAAIKNDNPGATLPAKAITVVIRKKGSSSGTTDIFTRYLSVVSEDFRSQFQTDGSFKWTIKTVSESGTAIEGSSNEEITAAVSTGDGRIGYADQGAVDQLNPPLPYAAIRNKTGRYITPTTDSVSAAATGSFIPDDFRTYIVDAEGSNTYPIVGFTWIITWRDLSQLPSPSQDKATALTSFLWWAIHQGQQTLPRGYAPLPDALIPRLERLFLADKSDPNAATKVFLYNKQPFLTQP